MIFIVLLMLVIIYYLIHVLKKEKKKILIFIILIIIEFVYCIYWFVPITFPIEEAQQLNIEILNLNNKQIILNEQQSQKLKAILLDSKLQRCYRFQLTKINNIKDGEFFYIRLFPKPNTDINLIGTTIFSTDSSYSFVEIYKNDFISNFISKIYQLIDNRFFYNYFKISNSKEIALFLNSLN